MKKFECLGGPLCGEKHEAIIGPREVEFPCFAYEVCARDDRPAELHYYRLASNKVDGKRQKYWLYVGNKGIKKTKKPSMTLRPFG